MRAAHGDKFSEKDLSAKFVRAYNNGERFRIKVRFDYGEEVWGYVAATTGWCPSFMLMRRRGQHGSSELLSDCDSIIAERWIK
jgi:hypothetical protein